MSRIGKKVIALPKGVEVKVDQGVVKVKGPKGSLERKLHTSMGVKIEGSNVTVQPKADTKLNKKFHGLTRTLIDNMVVGVTTGYTKSLTLVGVGYRAAQKGKGLTLNLGYSHPIDFDPPAGVELKVDKLTTVIVTGANKEDVGLVAEKIRGFRPPEPYHGKGVRYSEEKIATKVGKAAGAKK